MNKRQLNDYKEKAKTGSATISDIVEILTDLYVSQSAHFNTVEQNQKDMIQQINTITEDVKLIQKHTIASVYSVLIDDDDELNEEEEIIADPDDASLDDVSD